MDSYHPASTHTPTSTALHHQLADGEFGDTNANALLPTAGAARVWTMVGLIGLLGIFLAEMLFDLPEDWKLARCGVTLHIGQQHLTKRVQGRRCEYLPAGRQHERHESLARSRVRVAGVQMSN